MPEHVFANRSTILSQSSELQAFSGPSLSVSSSSLNDLGRGSQASTRSSSSFACNLTAPIIPSHPNRQHKLFQTAVEKIRTLRSPEIDGGYVSENERELFDAIAVIKERLAKAEPTVNTRRALRFMGRPRTAGSENDSPVAEQVQQPDLKVAAEEVDDWSNDFQSKNSESNELKKKLSTEDSDMVARPVQSITAADFIAGADDALLNLNFYEEILPLDSADGLNTNGAFVRVPLPLPTAATIPPALSEQNLEIDEFVFQHESPDHAGPMLDHREPPIPSVTRFQVWRDSPSSFETAIERSPFQSKSLPSIKDGPATRLPFMKKYIPLRPSKLRNEIVPEIFLQDATEGSLEIEPVPREIYEGYLTGSPSLHIWVASLQNNYNPGCDELPFEGYLEPVDSSMHVSDSHATLDAIISPPMPPSPVLVAFSHRNAGKREVPDHHSCDPASGSLDSSALHDSSISLSGFMLNTPEHFQREAACMSSPILPSETFNKGLNSLLSPVVTISSAMFPLRRLGRPLPMVPNATNLDACEQPLAASGLGMDLSPSELPGSDFPSFNSCSSILSLRAIPSAGKVFPEDGNPISYPLKFRSQSLEELDISSIAISGPDATEWGRIIEVPLSSPSLPGRAFGPSPNPPQNEFLHEQDNPVSPSPLAHALEPSLSSGNSELVAEVLDFGARENVDYTTSFDLSSSASCADVIALAEASSGAIMASSVSTSAGLDELQETNTAPEAIGLGLGYLVEATLQSSSSISMLLSPELPAVTKHSLGTKISPDSGSLHDIALAGRATLCVHTVSAEHDLPFSINIEQSSHLSGQRIFNEIEHAGTLPLARNTHRYSSNIEKWRRFCAECSPFNEDIPWSSPKFYPFPALGYRQHSAEAVSLPNSLMGRDASEYRIDHLFASPPQPCMPRSLTYLPQAEGNAYVSRPLTPTEQPILRESLHLRYVASQAHVSYRSHVESNPVQSSPKLADICRHHSLPALRRPLSARSRSLSSTSDPRSPVSPSHATLSHSKLVKIIQNQPSPSALLSISEESNCNSFSVPQAPQLQLNEAPPSSSNSPETEPPSTIYPSESSGHLRPSKSIEGLGMGLPSVLESRPQRQRDVSSSAIIDGIQGMMSTAEECENIANLALDSPTSDLASPTFMTSEIRGGSRYFFKIPKFAKRHLYSIPEMPSPVSHRSSSSAGRTSPPRNRLLSTTWSDIANLLRSPSKPGYSWFKRSPRQSALPLKSPTVNSLSPPLRSIDLPPSENEAVVTSSPRGSPLPTPESREPSAMNRLLFSGSSSSRTSTPTAVITSPGMTEHMDAPHDLGLLKPRVNKGRRLGSALRKFQLLF